MSMVGLQLFNQITTNQPGMTADQMRDYWSELETLLLRIEAAANPYQVLGIDRTAGYEEIWFAYQHHVALLYPSYSINSSFPDAMQTRVERTFAKVSRAFAVLASFGRRRKFDALTGVTREHRNRHEGLVTVADVIAEVTMPPASSLAAQLQKTVSLIDVANGLSAHQGNGHAVAALESPTDSSAAVSDKELLMTGKYPRRTPRFKMRVPVRVTGYSCRGSIWQEVASTGEVGRMGVSVRMRQRVRHGSVLYLTLALPTKLRAHNFSENDYKAYAIVRSVIPRGDGVRDVGLEFLGKYPPQGYFDKPWRAFSTDRWNGAERRRMPRFKVTEPVHLEFFTDTRQPLAKSSGVTETLSRGGACVRAAALPDEFDFVGITSPDHGFESLAVVTNRVAGHDGIERLCLQFIEQEWPI